MEITRQHIISFKHWAVEGSSQGWHFIPGWWLPSQQDLALGLCAQQCFSHSQSLSPCMLVKKNTSLCAYSWSMILFGGFHNTGKCPDKCNLKRYKKKKKKKQQMNKNPIHAFRTLILCLGNHGYCSFFIMWKGLDPIQCWVVWLQSSKALKVVLGLSLWVIYKGAIYKLTESRWLSELFDRGNSHWWFFTGRL